MKSYNTCKIIRLFTFLIVTMFFVAQNSYGAGAPKRSSPSPEEIRQKANVYFDSGERLQKEHRYKEASKEYEKAVRIDKTYAEAYSNLGYTYRKQGMLEKAVETYKKAIQLSPNLAEAHEYLGEAYAEMGKFKEAENELKILRDLGSDEADELEAFIQKMKAQKG